MNKSCVLLATYNGEPYLPTLIDSLLAQSYPHFDVLVHDDGSTDATYFILKEYQRSFPHRIFILDAGIVFRNPWKNFFFLAKNAEQYDYIYFCDQDDIWDIQKMEIYASTFENLEYTHSKNSSILLHSDLELIDKDENVLAPSLSQYQGNSKQHVNINTAYYKNHVTGCTIAINKPLLSTIDLNSPYVCMHDWWISLSALKSNSIHYYIDLPLVRYRQHDNNHCGIRTRMKTSSILEIILSFPRLLNNVTKYYKQCREFENVNLIIFTLRYIASKLH